VSRPVQVWYMCHPVGGDVAANLARAGRWLKWLRDRCPQTVVIAPWMTPLLTGADDDGDPEARERGLRDCCAVVERCDGVILCGGRVSTGMQREVDVCCEHGQGYVADLTGLGDEPPEDYDDQYPTDESMTAATCPLEVGMYQWEAK
jgi:hypothetical protein